MREQARAVVRPPKRRPGGFAAAAASVVDYGDASSEESEEGAAAADSQHLNDQGLATRKSAIFWCYQLCYLNIMHSRPCLRAH